MGTTDFDDRIQILPNSRELIRKVATEIIEHKEQEEAFFVCNLGNIIEKHREWIVNLPRVKPFYAVKCNDNEFVLKTLIGLGAGFDCASKGEMKKIVKEMGVHPNNVIFANPAKQASHIRAAREMKVNTMTFDNKSELHKIKVLHPEARLLLRIRCEAEKAQAPLGMKFGASMEESPTLLAVAKELGLNVVGISFHVGSGCMDPPVFRRAIESSRFLFDVGENIGHMMNMLDIGGGYPGNTGTSITDIATVVNGSLDEFFPEGCGVDIIAEPGRFYVASAFTLMTQIHSIREIKNEQGNDNFMYYINDGVYGSFNCVLYDHAVVLPETLRGSNANENLIESSIWGPTCDGMDKVCSNVFLPSMAVGEWLYFTDMGAYTLVAAGTFNGFPISKIHYIATVEAWHILKEFFPVENLVTENVPVFMKAAVGMDRDGIGWDGLNATSHPLKNRNMLNFPELFTQADPDSICLVTANGGGFYEFTPEELIAQ
jgi:ornithine decarboxylase